MEIGVDCINISRFKRSRLLNNSNLERIFSKKEIEYCKNKENPSQHYAVRFAAKEAIIKAFFAYEMKIKHNKIEILNNKNGLPFVKIIDDCFKTFDIKISLSHSKEIALAFVIIV